MLAYDIARKYARALFISAKEKNLLKQADEQFQQIKTLMLHDTSLRNFLSAPQIPEDKKLTLVRNVFSGRLERAFIEFIAVLIEKHRIAHLPAIADELDRLIKAEHGVGKATAITAVPLSASEESSLIGELSKMTGLRIELEKRVEPEILGGMIVLLHDRVIDGSVRHGLDLIGEQLEKVKVA